MMLRLFAILLICGLFGSILIAKPGVVRMTDGQVIEGDIIREEADSVTVVIRGIETSIPRDRIDSINYAESRAAQFEERRKQLAGDDVQGHLELARWGFDNRLYTETERLLRHVLAEVDPNNREADELLSVVRRQIALERRQEDRPAPQDDVQADGPGVAADEEYPLLTPDQIQRIKRVELQDNDTGVRIRVSNEIRRHVIEAARVNSRQFANLRPAQQLEAVRRFGTPEMVAEVEVLGDPTSLAAYRQRIQPIVLAGCAGAGCHAVPGAGDFALFPRADASEPASYTNFLILQEYTRSIETGSDGGIFDAGTAKLQMINRSRPDQSLLVQYMLPRNLANTPHPETRGYDGIARSTNDPRINQIIGWIRTLGPFESNYAIDYQLPGRSQTTQPAE